MKDKKDFWETFFMRAIAVLIVSANYYFGGMGWARVFKSEKPVRVGLFNALICLGLLILLIVLLNCIPDAKLVYACDTCFNQVAANQAEIDRYWRLIMLLIGLIIILIILSFIGLIIYAVYDYNEF